MTTVELHHCRKQGCYIRDLLDKGYDAIWPLGYKKEVRSGNFTWNLYIKWTKARGSRVNGRYLCEKHHKIILAMFQSEAQGDVEEQEATERWLKTVNSQMLSSR